MGLSLLSVCCGQCIYVTKTAVDDPGVELYGNYKCGAARNYTGYCNAKVET